MLLFLFCMFIVSISYQPLFLHVDIRTFLQIIDKTNVIIIPINVLKKQRPTWNCRLLVHCKTAYGNSLSRIIPHSHKLKLKSWNVVIFMEPWRRILFQTLYYFTSWVLVFDFNSSITTHLQCQFCEHVPLIKPIFRQQADIYRQW